MKLLHKSCGFNIFCRSDVRNISNIRNGGDGAVPPPIIAGLDPRALINVLVTERVFKQHSKSTQYNADPGLDDWKHCSSSTPKFSVSIV